MIKLQSCKCVSIVQYKKMSLLVANKRTRPNILCSQTGWNTFFRYCTEIILILEKNNSGRPPFLLSLNLAQLSTPYQLTHPSRLPLFPSISFSFLSVAIRFCQSQQAGDGWLSHLQRQQKRVVFFSYSCSSYKRLLCIYLSKHFTSKSHKSL